MAALISIFGVLTKDDRVASFRFLESTPRRYGNSKETFYGRITRFSKNLGFGNRTNNRGFKLNCDLKKIDLLHSIMTYHK